MTTALERRLAGIEAEVDRLAPKPDAYDAFVAANPWIRWMTCDELTELEKIYRIAEEAGAMELSAEARATAIYYAAEARRLAGEPADDEKPNPYRAAVEPPR
jgi:hypothetical protein